jgi:hypothetical protein
MQQGSAEERSASPVLLLHGCGRTAGGCEQGSTTVQRRGWVRCPFFSFFAMMPAWSILSSGIDLLFRHWFFSSGIHI